MDNPTTDTDATRPDLPLQGVRVLDLSRVFAGPLCGQVLADFGAEVIKVEHPGRGDDTRDWGIRIGKTETTYYNGMNRNKRSITLDLQNPEGLRIAYPADIINSAVDANSRDCNFTNGKVDKRQQQVEENIQRYPRRQIL